MITNLAETFPHAKGFKTERNAHKALSKALGMVDGPHYWVVVKRENGTFLPIILIGHNAWANFPGIASVNVCSANL